MPGPELCGSLGFAATTQAAYYGQTAAGQPDYSTAEFAIWDGPLTVDGGPLFCPSTTNPYTACLHANVNFVVSNGLDVLAPGSYQVQSGQAAIYEPTTPVRSSYVGGTVTLEQVVPLAVGTFDITIYADASETMPDGELSGSFATPFCGPIRLDRSC